MLPSSFLCMLSSTLLLLCWLCILLFPLLVGWYFRYGRLKLFKMNIVAGARRVLPASPDPAQACERQSVNSDRSGLRTYETKVDLDSNPVDMGSLPTASRRHEHRRDCTTHRRSGLRDHDNEHGLPLSLDPFAAGRYVFEFQCPRVSLPDVLSRHKNCIAVTIPVAKILDLLTKPDILELSKLHDVTLEPTAKVNRTPPYHALDGMRDQRKWAQLRLDLHMKV
ncbi:hypothetical protein DFH06DRAFT_1305935 [Mycena polygramma]|nr:hypothetical protein DFH06DRAFT_1305935 [Mycena polygramma]